MFKSQSREFENALTLAKGAIEHFTLARDIFVEEDDGSGTRWGDVMASDTYGCTLIEAVTFAITSLSAFVRLKADTKAATPIPELRGAISAVEILRAQSDQIYSSANNVKQYHGDIRFGDYASVVLKINGQIIYNPLPSINEVVGYSTDLVSKLGIIKSSSSATAKAQSLEEDKIVISRAKSASETLEKIDAEGVKLRNQIQITEERLSEIQAERIRASDMLSQLESRLSKDAQEIDRILTEASRLSEKVTEQSAIIQARHADVTQQAAETGAASKDIRAFAAQVETVRSRISELEEISERTVTNQISQRDQVNDLINEANKMLSGATVAGLASTFDAERRQLDESLKGAFRTFCAGAFLLTLFSLFIIMYVLNIQINPTFLGGIFIQSTPIKAHDVTVPGIVARSVILLAPLWFTQFSARRYRQLFDLRQQYAHKYNVAFSADGFVKASTSHQDEIMLWVFETVGANPAPPKHSRPLAMEEAPTNPIGGEASEKLTESSASFGKRLLQSIVGRMS